MTVINDLLRQYVQAIDSGFGLIGGDVRWLLTTLITINLVLAALMWAFSEDQVIANLARRVLYIGFFAWLVDNWAMLTDVVARSFVQLGLRAGGGRMSATDLMSDPGSIAERGLAAVTPMLQAIRDLSGPVAFFENLPEILLLALAALIVLMAFFLIAIQIVFAVLTFKLGALVAFVLVPFALLNRTAFIAERPLGWVVGAGVRLMVITLVVGLGERLFGQLELTVSEITVFKALDVALGALVLMLLALTASRLASDLVTGTPRLGALEAGFALAGTGAAIAYGARRTAAAASAAGASARQGATRAASAIRSHRQGESDSKAGD